MPSRLGVVLIVLFWLGVTGYVVHRDVWPRLFGDAPPAIRIDLSDEATQTVPARWAIYRGDAERVGTLTTVMRYTGTDDLFRFVSTYDKLKFSVSSLRCEVDKLESVVAVTRDGELRGQTLDGKVKAAVAVGPAEIPVGEASASVHAVVVAGQLVGRVKVASPLGSIDQSLDPVPVPGGQVLNPLQPVNRLQGVRPGRRWVIREVNPLAEALTAFGRGVVKEHAGTNLTLGSAGGDRPTLIAQVSDEPERLPTPTRFRITTHLTQRPEDTPSCWVIEYRGDQATARTWVRVSDGKVMLQQASGQGEDLRLERED